MIEDEQRKSFTYSKKTLLKMVHIIVPTIILFGIVFFIQSLEQESVRPFQYLWNCLLSPYNGNWHFKDIIIGLSVVLVVVFIVERLGFNKLNLFGLNQH